jgi:hypothetical protein
MRTMDHFNALLNEGHHLRGLSDQHQEEHPGANKSHQTSMMATRVIV